MKIGDKIIIDKEYYIKKYRETFGNETLILMKTVKYIFILKIMKIMKVVF